MLKRLRIFGAAVAATFCMAAAASAAPLIDFQGPTGAGGNLQLVGGNIIGTNVPLATLLVNEMPLANGPYTLSGSATTNGPAFPPGPFASLNFNTGTGSFVITGCVTGLNIGACNNATVLASGTIGSFIPAISGPNTVGIVFTNGTNTLNSGFAAAIGLPANTPFSFAASFSTATGSISGAGSPANSTDIRMAPVPEPATMMLLGTGLLAAFRARRRQA